MLSTLHNNILLKLSATNDSLLKSRVNEVLAFGYKNAISCIFPAFIFLVLALSKVVDLGIPRYDFLFVACVIAQILLIVLGIESRREVMVIMGFHLLGVIMEFHKVNVGSWTYPEEAFTKIAGVPLYSGFMYSSVASFICRAWENFDLKFIKWPKNYLSIPVGTAIYLNFFTNAYVQDVRWFIVALLVPIFWKTKVAFNNNGKHRKMPLLGSFVLIGFFIYLAENIATFFGAWKYSYQHDGWQVVDYHKMSSWALLVVVSIIIVAQLKMLKQTSKGNSVRRHHL